MSSTFDAFFLTLQQDPFDIIMLSETWLRDNKHLLGYIKMPGYNFLYKNRKQNHGGEVGAYIKEKFSFIAREDLDKIDTTIEQLWLEVKGKK